MTLKELKALSDEELIRQHDVHAGHTAYGVRHYIDELRYREQTRISQSIERLTKRIWWLTFAIFALTVINVLLIVVSLWLR